MAGWQDSERLRGGGAWWQIGMMADILEAERLNRWSGSMVVKQYNG